MQDLKRKKREREEKARDIRERPKTPTALFGHISNADDKTPCELGDFLPLHTRVSKSLELMQKNKVMEMG
jgi:hypothetical protein